MTQSSGVVPPGLTLDSDGTLTGTPTQVGTYEFTVQANNDVGTYQATVPVMISPATLRSGSLALASAWRRNVEATICTSPAHRTLIFPVTIR